MDVVTVLCVDDDPDLVSLTASLLEDGNERFRTITETDPGEAIGRVASDAVDCVVSDYDMPGMDGLELLDTIRESYPDLPFILFTGKGSEEVASAAIAHGVTDYLQKGTGENQYDLLANRVANAVEKYRAGKRAANLDRVRGILREVNRSLVRAGNRDAIERRVCEILVAADPYRLACVVTPTSSSGALDVRVSVSDEANDPAEFQAVDPEWIGSITTAIETAELVTTPLPEGETAADGAPAERGDGAIAIVPIMYDGVEYGALCLLAADDDTFDSMERELLEEIGGDLSHAIFRAELHDRLRRSERIITNLPVGVYRNSPLPDGTLLAVNPELVDLFDADDEDDLLGRPFRDLYADPADREQFLSALQRHGVVRNMELELETLPGEPFLASVTGIMTTENGDTYFDGVVQDVT